MLEGVLALLAKLLPRQRMSELGSGNMQVGSAQGDVVSSVTHHTQHITIIQTQGTVPAAGAPISAPSAAEQSAVLRRMGQLRDRIAVLNFMEDQFGTRMVIHLKPEQLYRLNRYLDVVLRDPRNVKHAPRTPTAK